MSNYEALEGQIEKCCFRFRIVTSLTSTLSGQLFWVMPPIRSGAAERAASPILEQSSEVILTR